LESEISNCTLSDDQLHWVIPGRDVDFTCMATIKEATKEDILLLTHLIRVSFRDVAEKFHLTPRNAAKHPSNCTEEWVRTALDKGHRYFLLEALEGPCGCAALERANSQVCYLERLAVLPEMRKRGFGEILVRHAVEEARKIGAQRLEIGIIAAQSDLRDWYIKRGFVWMRTRRFEHLPFEVAFMFMGLDAEAPPWSHL